MDKTYSESLISLGSEVLIDLGIFADGYIIVDREGVIRHCKIIRSCPGIFEEKEVLGKNVLEVYPELTEDSSYVYRALRGTATTNQFTERHFAGGEKVTYLENDYPIKRNGEIIGAICIVKYSNFMIREIDLSGEPSDVQEAAPQTAAARKPKRFKLSDIIGESEAIRQMKERILRTARTGSPVLIYGQTGTGKEMVAQSIYSESGRNKGPFLSQNCAAIPANLLESLFFGTVRGSYTGALDKEGIFEQAKGGVIFLDEINSMDLAMQAKLLKVIEEKQVTRIGSSKTILVDVRIIAAINEPPLTCIRQGKLRSDLFYRLSAVQIELPPLSERPEDIPVLVRHFVDRYHREINPQVKDVSPQVAWFFRTYSWPGNVRELKNTLEGAFNFAKGPLIEIEDLPGYMKNRMRQPSGDGNDPMDPGLPVFLDEPEPCGGLGSMLCPPEARAQVMPLKEAVEQYEKHYILSRVPYAYNLTDLARQLGMTRQALNYKLRKHGIHL